MSNLAALTRQRVALAYPGAVVVERGRGHITHRIGPDQLIWSGSVGVMHTESGQEIDTDFQVSTRSITGFGNPSLEIKAADYALYALPVLNSGVPTVRYERGGYHIQFAAHDLRWTNDLNQIQMIATPTSGTLTTPTRADELTWPNLYGAGRTLRFVPDGDRLVKWLDLSAAPPAPNATILGGGNPVMEFNEIIDFDSRLSVWVEGIEWNKKTQNDTRAEIEFRDETGAVRFVIPPAFGYMDGRALERTTGGVVRLKKQGNSLFVSVRFPYAWLQAATYPVHLDTTLNLQVGESADDCYIGNNGVNLAAGDISGAVISVPRHNGVETTTGIRFQNVAIAQGTALTSATLILTAHDTYSTGANIVSKWACHANDNAGAFVAGTKINAATRPRTTYTSDWQLNNVTTDVEYSKVVTTPVQAIINRAGFVSGNAIVLLGDDGTGGTDGEWQDFWSYDGSTTKAPKLDIVYTAGAAATFPPVPASRILKTSYSTLIRI